MQELVAVVAELEEVEAIQIGRNLLARVVVEIERMLGVTSHSRVEEVAIRSQHDLIESSQEHYVGRDLENAFAKHLRLAMSQLGTEGELSLRDDFLENRLKCRFNWPLD